MNHGDDDDNMVKDLQGLMMVMTCMMYQTKKLIKVKPILVMMRPSVARHDMAPYIRAYTSHIPNHPNSFQWVPKPTMDVTFLIILICFSGFLSLP